MAFKYSKSLTSQQKSALKGMAHHLNPILQVGDAGLTENFLLELKNALASHDLIKIKLSSKAENAAAKVESLEGLTKALPEHTHIVGRIGRTVIAYNEKEPKDAKLPLSKL